MNAKPNQISPAYVIASWIALAVGLSGFLIGLWNAGMGIEEKGYYFVVLAFGMFGAVSLQKSVRDRIDGILVSDMYFGICSGGNDHGCGIAGDWPVQCQKS